MLKVEHKNKKKLHHYTSGTEFSNALNFVVFFLCLSISSTKRDWLQTGLTYFSFSLKKNLQSVCKGYRNWKMIFFFCFISVDLKTNSWNSYLLKKMLLKMKWFIYSEKTWWRFCSVILFKWLSAVYCSLSTTVTDIDCFGPSFAIIIAVSINYL